jgi:hypothetical protein
MTGHQIVARKKLRSGAVCERYSITKRTLVRWVADPHLGFPQPLEINGIHYYEESELDAFDITCTRRQGDGKIMEPA